jgi:hypothetical protein
MNNLCLLPVTTSPQSRGSRPSHVVHVPTPVQGNTVVGLGLDQEGGLAVAAPAASGESGSPGRLSLVAELLGQAAQANPSWWLVPRSPALLINGMRPLPLASLQAGDLLAAGAGSWLVTSQWSPEPLPAPAELADRPCPVCGGALRLAPVCQCPCGRFYHLESPAAKDGDQLLNCYLAGPCGLCGRLPTLEPVLLLEPPEKLWDQDTAEQSVSTPAVGES